ncbi:MAG: ABC transporter permease [Candidatus Bipolaricaulota bacterium]|nr:ABC transporter permease [Candidatus Bipolaricaulota bacterium]MDW8030967.1 ABC transporter permease [Candidatus Bipolaricaulota bacterium]
MSTIETQPSLFQYRELLKNLVIKDLKVKYRNSFLGFLWSLLNPLMMIIVYSVVLRYILRVQIENFPLFLIIGILPWNLFSGTAIAATEAITGNANLIKKIAFPREVLPLATVLFHVAQFLLALLVFFPALAFLGAPWTPAIALYPLVLLLQVVFTGGVALFLSAIAVAYRDIKYLTEIALMILFWMTPVVYHFSMVPERVRWLFELNPMTAYITAYHDMLYWGRWPDAQMVLLGSLWAVLALGVGSWVFRRRQRLFTEDL